MIERLVSSVFFVSLTTVVAQPAIAQSGRARNTPAKPPVVEGPLETSPNQEFSDARLALATEVDGERIYRAREVDQRVRVTKKPEPSYTREARKRGIQGTVVLRCIFDSTAQITHLHVVSGLPYGLTDRAIQAARKIRFTPALKDGHPVSMWMQLEYNFSLY